MNNTQVLIKAAGGNRAIAKELGCDSATVWRWGVADKIPDAASLKSICEMTNNLIKPKDFGKK